MANSMPLYRDHYHWQHWFRTIAVCFDHSFSSFQPLSCCCFPFAPSLSAELPVGALEPVAFEQELGAGAAGASDYNQLGWASFGAQSALCRRFQRYCCLASDATVSLLSPTPSDRRHANYYVGKFPFLDL